MLWYRSKVEETEAQRGHGGLPVSLGHLEYFLESQQTLLYRVGCICLLCGLLAVPYRPCGLYSKWTCLLDYEVSLGVWVQVAGLWRKSNWEGQGGPTSNWGNHAWAWWLGMGTGLDAPVEGGRGRLLREEGKTQSGEAGLCQLQNLCRKHE